MEPILTVEDLEARLSEPMPRLIATLEQLPGGLVVLGVGGKMGPTLARMARRALDHLGRRDPVIGVARFSNSNLPALLRKHGIEPVACNLLEHDAVLHLPDMPNVIFMAGQKFGTKENPELTWVMNTLVPSYVAERYRHSRIVVFSTGCVYPLSPVASGGSREVDELGPLGDYANSCVGRERVFTFFSKQNGTRVALVRLNYAIDLRYGILLDVAQKVWHGEPIEVTMGYVNVIWQRDANAQAIQCLAHTANPPFPINVTGMETISIRTLAERFGELFDRPAHLTGQEAPTAWLSNASKAHTLFGPPSVSVDQLIVWTADWVRHGGVIFDKPTHFEVRDGKF
jgi:nucleoside-diphosphate-sugar epimerase